MKKRFKNRKEFIRIANELGLPDETVLAGMIDQVNKKPFSILVNNQRRFVNGSLKLPMDQQSRNIELLNQKIVEVKAAKAEAQNLKDDFVAAAKKEIV